MAMKKWLLLTQIIVKKETLQTLSIQTNLNCKIVEDIRNKNICLQIAMTLSHFKN